MSAVEMNMDEDILKVRYLKTSKIILILAVIYALWITILIMSVYFLGIYKLAFLTMDQWIISSIIILGVFVVLDIIWVLNRTGSPDVPAPELVYP